MKKIKTNLLLKMMQTKNIIKNNKGGITDVPIEMVIAVALALILMLALTVLFKDQIVPLLQEKLLSVFN